MTEQLTNALEHLRANDVPIEAAPRKWRRQGFTYYANGVGQMLTDAQVIEFAENTRTLHG